MLKNVIAKALGEFKAEITFHDLRVVKGTTHTNVLFDVVIPLGTKVDEKELIKALKTAIKAQDKKYLTVIKIDNSYIH